MEIEIEAGPQEYACIYKELIFDNIISPDCRFVLIFLSSTLNDSKITIEDVRNELKKWISKQSFEKILKEMIDNGYLKVEIKDNEKHYTFSYKKFKKTYWNTDENKKYTR